jgi:hypothetical protein
MRLRRMTTIAVILVSCISFWTASTRGGTVNFAAKTYRVSPALVALGFPEDWLVRRYYVTTDVDIQVIGGVEVTIQTLFQVPPPFGSVAEPPPPEFLPFDRRLNVDSWITTPGPTHLLGTDLPSDGTGTWVDLTDDGPQNRFWFAQITGSDYAGFSGRLRVAGSANAIPFFFGDSLIDRRELPFIPEPKTRLLLAIGLVAAAARGRRTSANRPAHSVMGRSATVAVPTSGSDGATTLTSLRTLVSRS